MDVGVLRDAASDCILPVERLSERELQMKSRLALPIAAAFLCAAALPAQQPAPSASPVLQAMKEELAHSLEGLKAQPVPPYFLGYGITETHNAEVTGSFGALYSSNESASRMLDLNLRVGDYSLDNTHEIRGDMPMFDVFDQFSFVQIPLENDKDVIRQILWYQTDQRYKRAVERLTKINTNVQVKVAAEDASADFSQEPGEKYSEPPAELHVDRAAWQQKIRKYTAPFARYGDIYEAQAIFTANAQTRWYVNSDGAELQTSSVYYRLFIYAVTKADDGMELPRYESYLAMKPEDLPDDATVLKAAAKMIDDLHALRKAPLLDPYTGPAILSGRASGVFFHEVFGHRIEGHRQKGEEQAQTFKKMVNQKVLPDTFSVISDPTLKRLGNTDLAGSYLYDDEGVKARRVDVVENGVLKNFLMSRSPISGFPHSNGHGRNQPGLQVVARQSNLIVSASKTVSRDELKKMLLEEIKKQNKPYGLFFDDIEGGFTMTGRTIPNAFNVLPVMVYRVYPDGREELVRGADLIGTPLTAFSKLLAADNDVAVFNGICGAESGNVPVSASSPDILISQIEVQKKEKSQERIPILPSPSEDHP
jgi:TldD protein